MCNTKQDGVQIAVPLLLIEHASVNIFIT